MYANYGIVVLVRALVCHLSFYACLMEGDDDYLVWPMSPLINEIITWLFNRVMVNNYSERAGFTHITTTLTLCL